MDIVSYLLELIETRKNVGINALGTLYKSKTPGRYDSETHSFLPPKYEIAFTPELKEDQELVNFIAEKRNISIESAHYYIAEFVEHIQTQLADHQEADFSPLGKLKLINDKIVLEFSTEPTMGFASYGLPSVSSIQNQGFEVNKYVSDNEKTDLNSIQEQNENQERVDLEESNENVVFEEQNNEEPLPVDTPKETAENVETPPPITDILDPLWKPTVINRYEYEEDDEEPSGKRWVRKVLRVLLTLFTIVVIVVVLIYFLYPDLFYTIKNKLQFQQPSETPTEVPSNPSGQSVKVDSSINHKNDTAISHDSLKKNVVFASLAKDTTHSKPLPSTITYEVIGSAMKTQKKVDEVISILAKRGINAKKMESLPGRLIKISLGTFTDFNLAKKYQDSLKIKLKNPEIYIQTIKPKH